MWNNPVGLLRSLRLGASRLHHLVLGLVGKELPALSGRTSRRALLPPACGDRPRAAHPDTSRAARCRDAPRQVPAGETGNDAGDQAEGSGHRSPSGRSRSRSLARRSEFHFPRSLPSAYIEDRPMAEYRARRIGIIDDQSKAFRAGRRTAPGEGRRHVLAFAGIDAGMRPLGGKAAVLSWKAMYPPISAAGEARAEAASHKRCSRSSLPFRTSCAFSSKALLKNAAACLSFSLCASAAYCRAVSQP